MASNVTVAEETVVKCGKDDQSGVQDVKHQFSEPWEDSDLILVVKNEKLHVHRVFLTINSPVFKAMFKAHFKEATSREIPLPDKKLNEVLDFLKQLYFPYISEQVKISLDNVEYLLKLSDEYQVKLIFDPCIKFVKDQVITRENVMKLRRIAVCYRLDYVQQSCDNVLKNMKLQLLSETVHLGDLDTAEARHFLEQRIERLETVLDAIYPQFMGLVVCLPWLMKESNRFFQPSLAYCQDHVTDSGKYTGTDLNVGTCERCDKMFRSFVCQTFTSSFVYCDNAYTPEQKYHYGGKHHFDESLQSVIQEFHSLKQG